MGEESILIGDDVFLDIVAGVCYGLAFRVELCAGCHRGRVLKGI